MTKTKFITIAPGLQVDISGKTPEQVKKATARLLASLLPKAPVGDVRHRTNLMPQSLYRKTRAKFNF